MKKIYLFAISVMLLATSCGHKKEGDATLVRPVKTATASSQSVIRKDFSGIVEAVEYVKLAFRVSGQVINLPVVEGQRVKKGQLIAAIDPRDISLQYAADKAAYETAAAQVERLVENYQRVNSGEGIVQLVNTQKLRIKFTVPDDYLYLLRAKDVTFKVVFDTYPGTVFNAKLEEYLDISTAGTGIPVTITIEDPAFNRSLYDVKQGFTCKIKLASDVAPFLEEKLVNIPLSAIFGESENQKTYVWVVKDNKVSKREVTVYSPTGEANALISAGIQPGETIVIAGVHQLVDGQTVKVIN